MSGAIITVEGLGKRYRLGAGGSGERYTALRDVISENVKGVFKKLKSGKLKARNGSGNSPFQSVSPSASTTSVSDSPNVSVSESPDAGVFRPSDEFWAVEKHQRSVACATRS